MKVTDILKYVEENENSAFFYTPNIYAEARSYFLKKPYRIITAKGKTEINRLLDEIDNLSHDPRLIGFGTIPYEIGYHFQPKEIKSLYLEDSVLKFVFYKNEDAEIINSNNLIFDDAAEHLNNKELIDNLTFDITQEEYSEKISRIKNYIARGDTYQINFTTKAEFKLVSSLTSLFLNGIFNQSAGYSVVINNKNDYILSFSPELFFKTDYDQIYSKPMKGTLRREGNSIADKKLSESLQRDEKNMAENVMIVDLIRNDIGRIAETDSVKVEKLYEVEKYETLYQLTSTITGKLKQKKLSGIFKNLFPSGSITGAPKLRSMQIIAELEKYPRKLYTGSIGLITNNSAVFNIPIRTLSINKETRKGEVGLGSGVVWDSDPLSEYEEVKLKSSFITFPPKYFELLETMLFEEGEIFLLEYHLERLKNSANYFLFKYDEKKIINELNMAIEKLGIRNKYKIRLLLNKWGGLTIQTSAVNKSKRKCKIIINMNREYDADKFLYHKTTNRPWDDQLKLQRQNGYDEILYVNEKNELLEGAVTNIVIEKDGELFTPPISIGILNGCYREYLIRNNKCKERVMNIDDLLKADKISLCNSVQKEIKVEEVFNQTGELILNINS